MVKFALMASHGYPSWLVGNGGVCRVIKGCQPFLPSHGVRPEIINPVSLNLRQIDSEEPWNPLSRLPESKKFVNIDSIVRRPVLVDIQDTHRNSVLFSFGIAEQCTRQEKIMQFLVSGSSEMERGLDLSLLSDLIGLQALTANMKQQLLPPSEQGYSHNDAEVQPSLVYPSCEFHVQKPLLDFVGDLARDSKIMVHPDGQVSFTGIGTEMKDLLSIVAEFYISKNSADLRKQTVVPYFNRPKSREARAGSSLNLKTVEVAPSKSSKNVKHKQSLKKSSKKAVTERDFYKKNYFHACESLLSLMIDKRRNGKPAVLWLKKSGPELPELLTHFSASIAGTGLAVLFSVIFKVACGRVPLCASKVLNTGFGFGLVWLSWAVNRLRDTIISISKNSAKLDSKEEEIIRTVDKSVKEIFFRAATLMAVAVLRLA